MARSLTLNRSMIHSVNTKNPAAVEQEAQAAYRALFPDADPQFVPRAFRWTVACFTGQNSDYQPVDARYHDLEHTMQGTLCLIRILRRRHEAGAQPRVTRHLFELGLLAILFHDTGYLKHREDTAGTGAKYTVTHVERSAAFAERFLTGQGFPIPDIRAVQNMIHCTGVDAVLHDIPFQSDLEQLVGHVLGTADLLGQMAAEDYVEKLPVLYAEFAEAAQLLPEKNHFICRFSNATDLVHNTPIFWEKYVLPKLAKDFGGLYRFLNDPFPDGRNEYLERIEASMQRIRGSV